MRRTALFALPLALLLAVVLLSACSQPRESRSGPATTGRTSSVGLSWALAGSQLAMLLVTLAVSRRLIARSAAARGTVAIDASVFDRAASEKEAQLPVALERLRRSTHVRWTPRRISLALPALFAVAVGLPAGFDQAAQWAFIAGALHLLVFGPWLAWLELFSHGVSELRRQQSLLRLSAGGGYFHRRRDRLRAGRALALTLATARRTSVRQGMIDAISRARYSSSSRRRPARCSHSSTTATAAPSARPTRTFEKATVTAAVTAMPTPAGAQLRKFGIAPPRACGVSLA